MKAGITVRGLDGLAARLAARYLPAASERAAAAAAVTLAADITRDTGAPATTTGPAARPVVRVADAALLARVRGAFDRPGDPVLDRIRLAFARRRR